MEFRDAEDGADTDTIPWSLLAEHTGTQSHPFSWVFQPQLELAFLREAEIRRNVQIGARNVQSRQLKLPQPQHTLISAHSS